MAQGTPWTWEWQPYPGVWLFVLALAGGYAWVRRRTVAGGSDDVAGWRTGAYAAAVLVLWAALDWPVGPLGAGYLASVHMVQFLLISLVAPPFLLLGLPPDALRALARRPRLGPVLGVLSRPLVALLFFTVNMAWTHWPVVVDTWMATQIGSFGLDLAWLISGLVFWWPVVAPEPEREWFGYPAKMGYLIVATIVNTGVFAYLAFSELPLYATYELAPPVSLLTTREDQLVAGLIMKLGGAVILWTAITVLFALWYRESQREDAEEALGRADRTGSEA